MPICVQRGKVCTGRRLGYNLCVGKIPWRKKIVTHCSILAWKVPWTEGPDGFQFVGLQKSQT